MMVMTMEAPVAPPPAIEPVGAGFVPRQPGPGQEWFARLAVAFVRAYAAVFRKVWPLCVLWPVPRLFGLRLVLRHEQVRDVLTRDDIFKVPFGQEIARLNDGEAPGTRFLLGDDDRLTHGAQAEAMSRVFPLREDLRRVAQIAYESAQSHLGTSADTRFEAIGDLMTAVPLDLCEQYFGVPLRADEREPFARASIELSGHLFGPPPILPSERGLENQAGDYVRAIVDRAIVLAERRLSGDMAVDRLLRHYGPSPSGRKQIRSVLIGMIIGFVPTNTMAGGYLLERLLQPRPHLKRPMEMWEETRRAAASGDDDRLARCLFEALRFKPINLGPFRICSRDYVVGNVTVRAGERVLAATSSAMFDSRVVEAPFAYLPGRPASHHLHFGFGMHWCIGAAIARVQLTQTFKALMLREPERASRLAYWGLFPYRLEISINGRTQR